MIYRALSETPLTGSCGCRMQDLDDDEAVSAFIAAGALAERALQHLSHYLQSRIASDWLLRMPRTGPGRRQGGERVHRRRRAG